MLVSYIDAICSSLHLIPPSQPPQEYTLQRSDREAPETVRVKTYLAGNLDSVAIEMSHRYRGRNKRFAFNSLLRGDTPIRAQLRSRSNHLDGNARKQAEDISQERSVLESDSDTESVDDLGGVGGNSGTPPEGKLDAEPVSDSSSESLYEQFMRSQTSSKMNVIRGKSLSRSDSSDDEMNTSSDCLTGHANHRHHHFSLSENQELDVETGMMNSHNNKPNVVIHQLNPIEMDIYERRVNFMKTHGENYAIFLCDCDGNCSVLMLMLIC